MDEERRIRFLIPPLLLIGSLLWGIFCDPDRSLQNLTGLRPDELGSMLGLLAGGGVIVVTFGFLLGTITLFFLRTGFRVFLGKYHEVVLSSEVLEEICNRLNVLPADTSKQNELFAGRCKPISNRSGRNGAAGETGVPAVASLSRNFANGPLAFH